MLAQPPSHLHQRRSAAVLHKVVEVLVDSVQEPEEKLLSIVLRAPTVLHGILGNDALQRDRGG